MAANRLKIHRENLDAYGIFWDECHSINSESSDSHSNSADSFREYSKDEDIFDDENDDIQWLNDIGFACVIGKYQESAEIDPNDSVLESMTATLTRNQSATVRKRIKSLNETWKKKKNDVHARYKHIDVRDVFPVQSDDYSRTSKTETVVSTHNGHSTASNSGIKRYMPMSSKLLPGLTIDSCFYNESQEQTFKSLNKEHFQRISPRTEDERSNSRHAVDSNLNILDSSSKRRSKSPQPAQTSRIRPPPPRRAKSEGLCRIQATGEDLSNSSSKHYKSPSEGSPVHCQELSTYARDTSNKTEDFTSIAKDNKHSRLLASSSQSLIASPAGQTVTKHKSEEDLSRLRRNQKLSTVQVDGAGNSSQCQNHLPNDFDGDAKLNIGSDSCGKDSSLLFSGQAFSELPNFSLKQEVLGMTRISDLSEDDMAKVRPLALIELTALFDTYGVDIKRRKNFARQKQKENGVFGVPLSVLWQKDLKQAKEDDLNVPKFFMELVTYLEQNSLKDEGLLRVPGSSQRIKSIREEIEECYGNNNTKFNWQGRRTTDMATILKQFLRELPTPLLTHEYQPTFIAVSDLREKKLQLQALNLLVLLMPPANRDTLLILLKFLAKVISHENTNKMDLNNVSMIMAPNLFLQPNSRANLNEIHKVAATTDIMRMLIKYHKIIWMVPDFMVTQIRYLYEAGSKAKDTKAVRKIIAKRIKSETNSSATQVKTRNYGSEDELDFAENENIPIIRVKAPMFNKTCMAIQLTDRTTASDIIARFRSKRNSIKELTEISRLTIGTDSKRNRSDSDLDREDNESITLHEVGGNIGERCLDPNTNMIALVKVNPNAEWVLRFKARH